MVDRSLALVLQWQRVGFVHGVMNTDNMSVHGITIDYGPYGWLEDYHPDWTPILQTAKIVAIVLAINLILCYGIYTNWLIPYIL